MCSSDLAILVPLHVPLVIVPTVARFDRDVNVVFEVAVIFPAVVAVVALPETSPVTLPVKFPVTLPVSAAVIVPALKFPLASLDTMAFAVLLLVAVVALFNTFPLVEIVANLLSAIAALDDISAFTIDPVKFNLL